MNLGDLMDQVALANKKRDKWWEQVGPVGRANWSNNSGGGGRGRKSAKWKATKSEEKAPKEPTKNEIGVKILGKKLAKHETNCNKSIWILSIGYILNLLFLFFNQFLLIIATNFLNQVCTKDFNIIRLKKLGILRRRDNTKEYGSKGWNQKFVILENYG